MLLKRVTAGVPSIAEARTGIVQLMTVRMSRDDLSDFPCVYLFPSGSCAHAEGFLRETLTCVVGRALRNGWILGTSPVFAAGLLSSLSESLQGDRRLAELSLSEGHPARLNVSR